MDYTDRPKMFSLDEVKALDRENRKISSSRGSSSYSGKPPKRFKPSPVSTKATTTSDDTNGLYRDRASERRSGAQDSGSYEAAMHSIQGYSKTPLPQAAATVSSSSSSGPPGIPMAAGIAPPGIPMTATGGGGGPPGVPMAGLRRKEEEVDMAVILEMKNRLANGDTLTLGEHLAMRGSGSSSNCGEKTGLAQALREMQVSKDGLLVKARPPAVAPDAVLSRVLQTSYQCQLPQPQSQSQSQSQSHEQAPVVILNPTNNAYRATAADRGYVPCRLAYSSMISSGGGGSIGLRDRIATALQTLADKDRNGGDMDRDRDSGKREIQHHHHHHVDEEPLPAPAPAPVPGGVGVTNKEMMITSIYDSDDDLGANAINCSNGSKEEGVNCNQQGGGGGGGGNDRDCMLGQLFDHSKRAAEEARREEDVHRGVQAVLQSVSKRSKAAEGSLGAALSGDAADYYG
jgi:hypothetical protein